MIHTDCIPKPHEELHNWPCGVVLEVIGGIDSGKRFVLELSTDGLTTDRLVGGRSATCDIVFNDTSVSEVHFALTFSSGVVRLSDLGSRNGTWSGHGRLDPGSSVQLLAGAEFRACNTTMRLVSIEERKVPVSQVTTFKGLRGTSESMRALFGKLGLIAPTSLSVILMGETGVGKGAVARAIHEASTRSGPYHKEDCGAFNRELIESTLFGHIKGAFTGANEARSGAFEVADGGTLFLDEIGELPLDLQTRLLTAIDEKTVTRLGESKPRLVDVRIIAATNRDLRVEVERGRFRADLYQRLRESELTIPPLRFRRDDIVPLAEHFVAELTAESGLPRFLSDAAKEELARILWPGNVRELRVAMKRAVVFSNKTIITELDLHLIDGDTTTRAAPDEASVEVDTAVPLKDNLAKTTIAYCTALMGCVDQDLDIAAQRAGYKLPGFKDLLRRHDLSNLLAPREK